MAPFFLDTVYYSYCQTRIHEKYEKNIVSSETLILRLKSVIDEGNFNLAGNLFHNTLPLYLYLIHLRP